MLGLSIDPGPSGDLVSLTLSAGPNCAWACGKNNNEEELQHLGATLATRSWGRTGETMQNIRHTLLRVALAGVIGLTAGVTAHADTDGPKRIERLGGANRFHKPAIESVSDLQAMAIDKRADIMSVLDMSGWGGSSADVMRTIASGDVSETMFPVEGALQWMALRRKGEATVARDLVWGGKEPFEAFEMTVISNRNKHFFLIPKVCGNLAYLGKEALPKPLCRVSTQPPKDCVTRTITIDGAGSTISEGRIKTYALSLTDPSGSKSDMGRPATTGSYRWTRSFREPGTYNFTAVCTSEHGIESDPATASVDIRACPPSCAVNIDADALYTGEEFSVDVSGSSAEVGEVSAVRIDILNGFGETVQTMELSSPFTATTTLERGGMYTFRAVAEDSVGQKSGNRCEDTIEIWPRYGMFAEALAGTERRWREGYPSDRSAPLVGVKAGPYYRVTPNFETGPGVSGLRSTPVTMRTRPPTSTWKRTS